MPIFFCCFLGNPDPSNICVTSPPQAPVRISGVITKLLFGLGVKVEMKSHNTKDNHNSNVSPGAKVGARLRLEGFRSVLVWMHILAFCEMLCGQLLSRRITFSHGFQCIVCIFREKEREIAYP